MSDANDVLKYSVAAALLMAGAAPAYYFIFYLPQKDALARQEIQDERNSRKEAEDARRSKYEGCVEQATTDYSSDWDLNCKSRHEKAVEVYNICKKYGGSETACAKPLNDAPAENCALDIDLSERLGNALARRKAICLSEFKAG